MWTHEYRILKNVEDFGRWFSPVIQSVIRKIIDLTHWLCDEIVKVLCEKKS